MEWVRLLKTFILLDLQFQRAQSDFNESVTDGTLHHKTRNKKNASGICGFTISVWIHLCAHRACSYFVISWALMHADDTQHDEWVKKCLDHRSIHLSWWSRFHCWRSVWWLHDFMLWNWNLWRNATIYEPRWIFPLEFRQMWFQARYKD